MRLSIAYFVFLVLGVAVSGACAAEVEFLNEQFSYDKQAPAIGYWVGNITLPDDSTQFMALQVNRTNNDAWLVKAIWLNAGALDAPCEAIQLDDRSLAFALPSQVGAFTFNGTISDDGQRYRGTIDLPQRIAQQFQPPEAQDDSTTRANTQPDDPQGEFVLARRPEVMDLDDPLAYTGSLQVPQMGELKLNVVFAQTPGGNWVGHMDVPAQSILGFPLVNIHEQDDGAFEAKAFIEPYPVKFNVRFEDDRRRIVGMFKQFTMNLDVDFARNEGYAGPKLNRPQHPAPPYPYRTREVNVEHPAGHVLAGTLTIPRGEGPFPAAILITGSGPQDRDETLLGHKPFLVVADHLTRRGIAVLRYDDRGTAQSTGTFTGATSKDFATDAIAAYRFLETIDEIDGQYIGFIGHSEGGMVAPLAATMMDEQPAYLVLMAGVGVPGDELLRKQMRLLMKAAGTDQKTIDQWMSEQETFFQLVRENASSEKLREAIRPVLMAQMKAMAGGDSEVTEQQLEQMIEPSLEQMTSKWMQYFLRFDPEPVLKQVNCPVLAINGTKDLQVWHEQNLDAIQRIIKQAEGEITIKRYEGLNHLFQPAETGSIMEYGEIEITIADHVLRDLHEWIKQQVAE